MASSVARKLAISATVLALMLLTALCANQLALPGTSPRLMVLAGLALLIMGAQLWRQLQRLERSSLAGAPAPNMPLPQAQAELLAQAARLEHAPVALLRLDAQGGLSALNNHARRLLAPGGLRDPAALAAQLARHSAGARTMLSFESERGDERALATLNQITLHGQPERIAALLPLEGELESETLAAWRALVQVLTHEIMNSLTPVASLAQTAPLLLDEVLAQPALGASDELRSAIDAIGRRAASLVGFVTSYRSLANVPPPTPEHVALAQLLDRLGTLLAPAWQARGGSLQLRCEPASVMLMADPGQLEQALINLIQNAADATFHLEQPQAQVVARSGRGGRLQIEVSDNGPGIAPELLPHIFTPFFSTKQGGRGLGLALVRQLLHGNGASVRHVRPVGGGARFVISF